MGRDAKASLWVGFKLADISIREQLAKLPESFGAYELKKVKCSEETVGYGIVVFSHDWDYGVIEFDASSIKRKVEEARAALIAMLAEEEIELDVGVWFQTDFA